MSLADVAAQKKAASDADDAKAAVQWYARCLATAAKGAAEYNRKVIEAARANANAAFDYAIALIEVTCSASPMRKKSSASKCRNVR